MIDDDIKFNNYKEVIFMLLAIAFFSSLMYFGPSIIEDDFKVENNEIIIE